ncbi:MAG TPA: hypothetical protein VGC79_28360 [Polyangiaceae bacterium]
MATKNLARTVIEGGRTRGSTWARRASNGVQRTHVHRVSGSLLSGADAEHVVYPRRNKVYRQFADKLGPAKRWLATQVGRPWNKARSELFARFDIRTTPGRHIVFDHLLPEVEGRRWLRRDYVVDRSGILRKAKRR